MSDIRVGRSPRSEPEWVRQTEQRLKALERKQTVRLGDGWVLSSQDGRPVLTRPGAPVLEVGSEVVPERVDLASRGSTVVSTAEIAQAVGYPEFNPLAPPTIEQIRQWMVTNLFGTVGANRIPQLPWSHLFGGTAELLDDPGFDSSATFSSGDPKVNRDAQFGRRKPGSARIDCDGAPHVVVSNLIPVDEGEELPIGTWVFYEELAALSAPVRVSVRAYHRNDDDSLSLLSTTQVAALSVLSGDSADHPDQEDDWVWLGGTYTVPGPIGGLSVDGVVLEVKVEATDGTVWVDDGTVTKTRDGMPQEWILNLVPDLASLWNGLGGLVEQLMTQLGLTPGSDFFDNVFDLSDELAWIQDRAAQGVEDAQQALGNLSDFLANGWQALLNGVKGSAGGGISDIINRLTNITSGGLFDVTKMSTANGTAPQSIITDLPTDLAGLQGTLNQFQDIFNGVVVTPINSIVAAVKDWWDQWFGGGSTNAIPLSQKGAANGVAPLNSSTKLATSYLETNVPNGVAGLNGSGVVPAARVGDLSALYLPASTPLDFVPTSAKGAALGVAPLNSNVVVPLEFLPEEVGGSGGSGDGLPYVILTLQADVTVVNNTNTLITGWGQSGSSGVTFEDGTNARWKFNREGWWQMEFFIGWGPQISATGYRLAELYRDVENSSDGGSTWTPDNGLHGFNSFNVNDYPSVYGPGNYWTATVKVAPFETTVGLTGTNRLRFDTDNYFSVRVQHNHGSNRTVKGAAPYPGIGGYGSYVLCTYRGTT